MLLICLCLLLFGFALAQRASQRSNGVVEVAAGLLIIGGLVLLGYQLHKIISV